MQDFRVIIWDWNGTLLNDAKHGHACTVDMCKARKISPPDFEFYQKHYQHPVEPFYQKLGFDFNKYAFSDLATEWTEKYRKGLEQVYLHEDTIPTLTRLKLRKFTQAILSALPHELLNHSVETRGIKPFFTRIQGQNDNLGTGKIEFGHRLMKVLGAEPEETILIGDSTHDYQVAAALGISCVLVSRGYEHEDNLRKTGATVLKDLASLAEYGIG